MVYVTNKEKTLWKIISIWIPKHLWYVFFRVILSVWNHNNYVNLNLRLKYDKFSVCFEWQISNSILFDGEMLLLRMKTIYITLIYTGISEMRMLHCMRWRKNQYFLIKYNHFPSCKSASWHFVWNIINSTSALNNDFTVSVYRVGAVKWTRYEAKWHYSVCTA